LLLFCVASSVCKINIKLISSPFSSQSAKASKNIHDILCIYGAGMKEKSKCSEPITSEFQTVLLILFSNNLNMFKSLSFVYLEIYCSFTVNAHPRDIKLNIVSFLKISICD